MIKLSRSRFGQVKAMPKTEANGLMVMTSSTTLRRALRISALALGVGLLLASGVARAQEDDDDMTFEEKIIEGLMKGIGATNMDNAGIDYRERSPLVVPPKLDLKPPASAEAEAKVPNWPKDPDEARRKAMIAERKKQKKDTRDAVMTAREASRPLLPSELNVAKGKPDPDPRGLDSKQPGGDPGRNVMLSPSQLGYEGGFLGMFKGNTSESTQFKGEPTRDSLTQPPPGYQTPSPNYAYGTGPKESLNKVYNPAAGKYGD
jgi:hypothetical protein